MESSVNYLKKLGRDAGHSRRALYLPVFAGEVLRRTRPNATCILTSPCIARQSALPH